MIKLYQFKPVWGLPNASPFCLKLETYLRMAKIPFEVVICMNPRQAPKGKLPYIEDKGKKFADSHFIIEYLKLTYGDMLDKQLSLPEKSVALALQRLIEENLYWCLVYSRWIEAAGWERTKKDFFSHLPPVIRSVVPWLVNKQMVKAFQGHGMGRHSRPEIYDIGMSDLSALSGFLDDKPYLMGNQPTTVDASAYGFLANILWAPIKSPLKEWLQKLPNLVAYSIRMKERFYLNGQSAEESTFQPQLF